MKQNQSQPRDVFTRKLREICTKLDAHAQSMGSVDDSFHVKSLWAVGSWARGAAACGDLDLVIQCAGKGDFHKDTRQLLRSIIGSKRQVDIFIGNLEANTSGVVFADGILLWSGSGCDWQSAILAIKVDPKAKRLPRAWDEFPFEYRQFNSEQTNDSLNKLLALRRDGVIQWDVLDLNKEDTQEFDIGDGFDAELLEIGMERWSKSRQATARAVVRGYLLTDEMNFNCIVEKSGAFASITFNRSKVSVCNPYVPVDRLMNEFNLSSYIYALPWRDNQQNIAWRFRRGQSHPLTKAFEHTTAWTVCDMETREISRESWIGNGGVFGQQIASMLQLFSTRDSAIEEVETIAEYAEDSIDRYDVLELRGTQLLDAISGSDIVNIDHDAHGLSKIACGVMGDDCILTKSLFELVEKLS